MGPQIWALEYGIGVVLISLTGKHFRLLWSHIIWSLLIGMREAIKLKVRHLEVYGD
jgi:hypothetical protein